MAADWLGISSSHLESDCGDDGLNTIEDALDGIGGWGHTTDHTHWFIVDLGQRYNVQKVRARSNSVEDPIDVNIYVHPTTNTEGGDWGDAVASDISTWQDTADWVEIDTTDKEGRYVKVEIIDTEDVLENSIIFGNTSSPFAIFDAYGELFSSGAAIVEAATASDTQNGLVVGTSAIIEAASATEAQDRSLIHTTEITESASAAEAESGLTVRVAEITEAATAEDEGTGTGDYLAEITESAAAEDEEDRSILQTVGITESAGAEDEEDRSILQTVGITESAGAAETEAGSRVVTSGTAETASAEDASDSTLRYVNIPPTMQKDLIDPYSGGAWLWLAEIAVSGYSTQRIARNTEDVVYGADTFEKFNLQIGEQMFSGDGSIPRVTLKVFQDVNRKIEEIVNETEGALGADIKLIKVCEKFLDTPISALEADYENLAAESDSEWVTFTLGIPNPLTQRIPLRIYSASMCPWATPSLFKGPECQYAGEDDSCTGTYEDCYQKGNAVHWGGELGLDPNVI